MKTSVRILVGAFCLSIISNWMLLRANAQISNCVPAPAGLVGIWRGDGNALDTGGTNNGVTPFGIAYAPGMVNQAFDFDGSSRRVSVADGPAFKLTNSLTIEGWVYPRQYDTGFIFFRGDNRGGLDAWTLDMYHSGYLNFQIDDAANNYASVLAPIAINQWQHIAATLDGTTGDMRVYINGILVAQTNTTVRPIGDLDPANDPAIGIGNHGGTFHQFPFNGLIDEISLYSRALSQSEIQNIYSAAGGGKCSPVVTGVPFISDMVPAIGAPGAQVVITGKNFNSTASNNIVYFGAVRANVVAGSQTNIVAVVPSGATYSPVTVTVNGLVAASGKAFQPAFSGGTNISASSFSVSTNLAAADGPIFTAIGDMDGDGKPDLAIANAYAHNISLYRNVSGIGTFAFGPRVDFAVIGSTSDNPYGLALADVDGDGKLDVLICDRGAGRILVYRNTAVSGMLDTSSLAAPVSFLVGADPRHIAVADLNGDGRPDIASANYGANTISVLQNIGVAGTLNTDSFAAKVDYATANGPYDIASADLDGDGKLDLALWGDGTMSVFRNSSSGGAFGGGSFAARLDYAAPSGGTGIALGDLDGDGKVDILGTAFSTSVISVFRNTSVPGSTAFASRVDFLPGCWGHTLALGDLNGDGKTDLSFVGELPSKMSIYQNLSVPGSFDASSFASPVEFGTGWNAWGVSVGDLDGDSRPDVVFCNSYDDTLTLYRNVSPISPVSSCTAAPSGLVGFWRGEGNALDDAGADDGIVFGNVAFGAGKVGETFVFDGATGSILVPQSPSLNVQSFTIEGWINPSDVSSQVPIAEYAASNGWSGVHLWISVPLGGGPGCLFANVRSLSSGLDQNILSSTPGLIRSNEWSYVALTYDQASGQAQLYLNGTNVASKNLGSIVPNTALPLNIGLRPATGPEGGAGAHFPGKIDELSLYNRALNGAEIQAVFYAGNAGKCPSVPQQTCTPAPSGLIGWWRADGTTSDAAGGNHGTIAGNMSYTAGESGQSFNIAGGSGHVQVPDSDLWAFGSNDFSIELWANFNAIPDAALEQPQGGLLIGNDEGPYWVNKWFFAYGGGVLSFHINDPANGPVWIAQTPFSPGTNQWYHLGVSRSGQVFTIYVDGVAIGSETNNRVVPNANASLTIGQAEGFYFNGALDEVSIYRSALSASDMQAIFNAGSAEKCHVPVSPQIIFQPTNRTIYVGGTAMFSVTASGDAPLGYQWQFNGDNLIGRTSASLTIANAQLSNAGNYSVVVTNPVGSVTSLVATLTVNVPPSCTPPPSGLISWWRFENSLLDNWDSNNGTTTSFGVAYASGKAGTAFSVLNSRYVLVPDSPSLHVTNGLTLEAWINPSGSSPLRTIVAKSENPTLQPYGMQSSFYFGLTNAGNLLFWVSKTGSARTNTAVISAQSVPLNQWSHVAATYDGNAIRVYLNGTLIAQTNYSEGIFAGAANLGIGAIQFNSTSTSPFLPFTGLIDEVSIYSRALTESEIQSIYNSDFVGKCLVAPTIAGQPQSRVIPQGEDVMFGVSVLGSRPLRYQWRYTARDIKSNGFWQDIPGATNATLLLEKVQSNRVGYYSVIVSNTMGVAVSSNALLTLSSQPACVSTLTNIISWWAGDGNVLDAIDGNGGVLFSPTLYATGKVGVAFSFNGLSSRLQVNNSASLNFSNNVNFSIECWVKAYPTNSLLYTNVVILEKRSPGTSVSGYSFGLNQGRLAFWLGTYPGGPNYSAMFTSGGPDLRDGMFHHVAAIIDRTSTNSAKLLVDGQVVLTFDASNRAGDLSSTYPLTIGAPYLAGSGSGFFYGLIDEVAIYRRALSTNEVQAIAGAGSAGRCKEKPFIITQPASVKANVGSNVVFSVIAGGSSPLRYQWRQNGVTISGATNSSYTKLVQSGGTYSVIVSNAFGSVLSSNAVLTLNYPPQALAGTVTLNEDTNALVTLAAMDVNLDPLTFSIVAGPYHGTLTGASNAWVYTPQADYFGSDSFQFKASDGMADSAPATVSITVLPVEDAPVAQSQAVSVDEDNALPITLGAYDADSDYLFYTVVSAPAHGLLGGTPPNLVYVPNTNYFGPDSFTFKVWDNWLEWSTATVSITVRPVNDAPVARMSVTPLFGFLGIANLIAIAPDNIQAKLVLDGSQSSDAENDPLTHLWIDGTNQLSTAVTFTNAFEVGTHDFTLHVSDAGATGVDTKTVEVITPAQALSLLLEQIENSSLTRNARRPLVTSIKNVAAAFEHDRFTPGGNQLQAFQNKVRAQVAPSDPALAERLINTAQTIINALEAK